MVLQSGGRCVRFFKALARLFKASPRRCLETSPTHQKYFIYQKRWKDAEGKVGLRLLQTEPYNQLHFARLQEIYFHLYLSMWSLTWWILHQALKPLYSRRLRGILTKKKFYSSKRRPKRQSTRRQSSLSPSAVGTPDNILGNSLQLPRFSANLWDTLAKRPIHSEPRIYEARVSHCHGAKIGNQGQTSYPPCCKEVSRVHGCCFMLEALLIQQWHSDWEDAPF